MSNDKEYGEGNHRASREYDAQTTEAAKDQAKIERDARDAEQALDGEEAEELRDAEAEGKSHAKA